MRKVLFALVILFFLVSCGSKTYYECKKPIETKDGRILCEK